MPTISLTDFIDFVVSTGTSRMTKVRNAKCRPDYNPMFDYWKQLRGAIVAFHEAGPTADKNAFFRDFLAGLNDEARRTGFTPVVNNYKKFLGKKTVTALPVRRTTWTHGDLTVRINPEIFLNIDGSRELIKLYFKQDSLSKQKTDTILSLMSSSLPDNDQVDSYVIYDAKNHKVNKSVAPDLNLMILIQAEAEAYVFIWNAIECPK